MKNLNPLEKDIERCVCDYAKSLKMLVYKFTSPSRRSVPDRMFITQNGVVFFIEFKKRGEKPTKAQEVEIAKIRATGVRVFVADDVHGGKARIAYMSAMIDGDLGLPTPGMPRVMDIPLEGGIFPEGMGDCVQRIKDPLDEY